MADIFEDQPSSGEGSSLRSRLIAVFVVGIVLIGVGAAVPHVIGGFEFRVPGGPWTFVLQSVLAAVGNALLVGVVVGAILAVVLRGR